MAGYIAFIIIAASTWLVAGTLAAMLLGFVLSPGWAISVGTLVGFIVTDWALGRVCRN